MKIKTSELTGAALNWAVAKCEGNDPVKDGGVGLSYSTDWLAGGPIIESNEIDLKVVEEGVWQASNFFNDLAIHHFLGDSPLEAAMRCHCCAKLGDIIDVPEELWQQQNS